MLDQRRQVLWDFHCNLCLSVDNALHNVLRYTTLHPFLDQGSLDHVDWRLAREFLPLAYLLPCLLAFKWIKFKAC